MTVFIQLAPATGLSSDPMRYHTGFQEYVAKHKGSADSVVVVETTEKPRRVQINACLHHSDVQWVHAHVGMESGSQTYFTNALESHRDIHSPDKEFVRFFTPATYLRQYQLISISIYDLVSSHQGRELFLSLDISALGPEWFHASLWRALKIERIHISSVYADKLEHLCQVLESLSYRRSGRLWGEAGSGIYMTRTDSSLSLARALLRQFRIVAGQNVLRLKDLWGRIVFNTRVWVYRQLCRVQRFGMSGLFLRSAARGNDSLSPNQTLRLAQSNSLENFSVTRTPIRNVTAIENVPESCFSRTGFWPISFSFPGKFLPVCESPTRLLSETLPGLPYVFLDEDEYLESYANAHMAITFRKAGWDCMRHLEILAAGCAPLMPDIDEVPTFCMVHYPKEVFSTIWRRFRENREFPCHETRLALQSYARENLTSLSMSRYLLRTAGFPDHSRVLFFDDSLPHQLDYLSAMTLVGLQQRPDAETASFRTVDYLYQDTDWDTQALYGRGFFLSKTLEPKARLQSLPMNQLDVRTALKQYDPDVVVVGSIERNWELGQEITRYFDPSATIWIHGEDRPPGPHMTSSLQRSGAHVFVRAIEI